MDELLLRSHWIQDLGKNWSCKKKEKNENWLIRNQDGKGGSSAEYIYKPYLIPDSRQTKLVFCHWGYEGSTHRVSSFLGIIVIIWQDIGWTISRNETGLYRVPASLWLTHCLSMYPIHGILSFPWPNWIRKTLIGQDQTRWAEYEATQHAEWVKRGLGRRDDWIRAQFARGPTWDRWSRWRSGQTLKTPFRLVMSLDWSFEIY